MNVPALPARGLQSLPWLSGYSRMLLGAEGFGGGGSWDKFKSCVAPVKRKSRPSGVGVSCPVPF